jgi:CsoR family transcriptional regulator, copper-sensing transcriptional repressor
MKANPEIVNRVRRIEGQARGIERMMEEGRACAEIVTQIAALRAAVDRLGYQMIATNLRACLNDVELPKNTTLELESSLAALSGMRT